MQQLYLTQHSELLSISLGKAARSNMCRVADLLGFPAAGDSRQLLETGGQPLPHDAHQLGVDFVLVHAQILQPRTSVDAGSR